MIYTMERIWCTFQWVIFPICVPYIPLNPMKNPIKPPFSYGFPICVPYQFQGFHRWLELWSEPAEAETETETTKPLAAWGAEKKVVSWVGFNHQFWWIYMVLYGFIWFYMVLYGVIWCYMVLWEFNPWVGVGRWVSTRNLVIFRVELFIYQSVYDQFIGDYDAP